MTFFCQQLFSDFNVVYIESPISWKSNSVFIKLNTESINKIYIHVCSVSTLISTTATQVLHTSPHIKKIFICFLGKKYYLFVKKKCAHVKYVWYRFGSNIFDFREFHLRVTVETNSRNQIPDYMLKRSESLTTRITPVLVVIYMASFIFQALSWKN